MKILLLAVTFMVIGCDAAPIKVKAASSSISTAESVSKTIIEPPTIIPTETIPPPIATPKSSQPKVIGGFSINNGRSVSSTTNVSLDITPIIDAIQMKISESASFTNATWQPINTTANYVFTSTGLKKLYVKFIDSNEVESKTFEASINIVIFGSNEGTFTINAGAATSNNSLVTLNINLPINSDKMMLCENNLFTACNWENKLATKPYEFNNDGSKTLYIKYKSIDTFESQIQSASIFINTNP